MKQPDYNDIELQVVRYNELATSTSSERLQEIFTHITQEKEKQLGQYK